MSLLFHIVELDVFNPATGSTETLRYSDAGYVSDSGAAYPPFVESAFSMQRGLVLSPVSGQSSNTWGSLTLNNPGGILNPLLTSRVNDHMAVRIKYGYKTIDTARGGYQVDPKYATLKNAFVGLGKTWSPGTTQVTIVLLDVTARLSDAVNIGVYGGTGKLDGDANVSGRNKPRARGDVRNITPVLIDTANQVYQVSDSSIGSLTLYEGGHTGGIVNANGDNGTVDDVYASSPAPGTYTLQIGQSGSYFRLGSKPVYPITCDTSGQFPPSQYLDPGAATVISILRQMLLIDFGFPAASIDAAWPMALQNANTLGLYGGWYWDGSDEPTGTGAIATLVTGAGASVVPTRNGTLLPISIVPPESITTAVKLAITDDILIDIAPVDLDDALSPPAWRWRIGYQHNFTVIPQGSNLGPSATATEQGFVAVADRTATWSDATVKSRYVKANDADLIVTALNNGDNATMIANRLGALFGVQRRIWACTVPRDTAYGVDLGDLVSITSAAPGLSAGVKGIVVAESATSGDSTAILQVMV